MNKAMLLKQYMSYSPKKSRLPSAYQEVEYIESTGTQYIDSGYNINDNKVKIQIKFRITDWNESGFYFGCGYTSGENGFTANISYLAIGSNSISAFPNQDSMVGIINELEMEANESTKKYSYSINNGTSVIGSYSGTIKSNLSMPIFKGTLYSGCCDCRVYSFRLYANDVLQRDFIPCYRKSDNEIGLYDIVNNQFYTNQGTGSFLCGRPLVNIDGYEQLDYIESNGTQYIDTQVKANSNTNTELIVTLNKSIGGYLYGTQDSWANKMYSAYYNKGKAIAMGFGADWLPYNSSLDWNIVHSIKIDNKKLYLDNVQVESSSETFDFGSYNLYIFTINDKGTPTESSSVKCHYFKIINNGTLIRNLIPMRRLSDNELGLYDLVNGVFYTNQGSGSFIAGEILKA